MNSEIFPYISVIIIAHDRKEYIAEAIKSVLHQTLDKNLYEILVIKNFYDEEIDSFIKNNGIVNIFTDEIELGKNIKTAIKKAKGEVIAFLDDDDLFYPEKLKIVYDKFKNNPNLCYYHHGRSTIDENSNLISKNFNFIYNLLNYDFAIEYNKKNKSIINCYIFPILYGNLSATCIRKEITLKNIELIERIIKASDLGIFTTALISDCSLLYDPVLLSYFRVHESTSQVVTKDFKKFVDKKLELFNYNKQEYDILLKAIPENLRIRNCFIVKKIENDMDLYFYSNDYDKPKRKQVLQYAKISTINLLSLFFKKYTCKSEAIKLLLSKSLKIITLLLFPKIGKKIYIKLVKEYFLK